MRAPGDDLRVRDAEGATRPPSRLAHPEPNAPLLKRVIRTPYALETVRHERERYLEDLPVRTGPEVRERPGEWRAHAERERFTSPLRRFVHRPSHRPHPFARARALAGDPGEVP